MPRYQQVRHDNSPRAKLARSLRELRAGAANSGDSVPEVARQIGVSRSNLYKVLKGAVLPPADVVRRLAEFWGGDAAALLSLHSDAAEWAASTPPRDARALVGQVMAALVEHELVLISDQPLEPRTERAVLREVDLFIDGLLKASGTTGRLAVRTLGGELVELREVLPRLLDEACGVVTPESSTVV